MCRLERFAELETLCRGCAEFGRLDADAVAVALALCRPNASCPRQGENSLLNFEQVVLFASRVSTPSR